MSLCGRRAVNNDDQGVKMKRQREKGK